MNRELFEILLLRLVGLWSQTGTVHADPFIIAAWPILEVNQDFSPLGVHFNYFWGEPVISKISCLNQGTGYEFHLSWRAWRRFGRRSRPARLPASTTATFPSFGWGRGLSFHPNDISSGGVRHFNSKFWPMSLTESKGKGMQTKRNSILRKELYYFFIPHHNTVDAISGVAVQVIQGQWPKAFWISVYECLPF